MAYKQYTKCVAPGSFVDLSPENWVGLVLIGQGVLALLAIVTLAVIAALSPLSSKPAILVAIILVGEIIAFLTWWLEGRLICLNEEERNCAIIGRVKSHGLASSFKGGDDDYTMNLILAAGQEHLLPAVLVREDSRSGGSGNRRQPGRSAERLDHPSARGRLQAADHHYVIGEPAPGGGGGGFKKPSTVLSTNSHVAGQSIRVTSKRIVLSCTE